MSNNAHVNDDEIEIHQLPEVSTLQAGMMVAVDSQPTGTKSFNLTTALEGKASASDFTALENTVAEKANTSDVATALEGKVDAPATTPVEGQVLTFNGSANTWANPPEGVYVLNYTEVSDLNDIDINRVKSQPTFMKVDTDITVSIPTSGTPYTVSVQQGTLMAIDEIGPEGTSGSYTGPRFISFYANNGKGVGGGIMQNADLKVVCMVSLSQFGGVTKAWGATGFLNSDGALLRTMPAPVTFKCTNSRGPGSDSVTTNHALKVEIQSYGSIRTQSLPPAEIEDHDFSSDTTPEQIQFMGWGATSNRAGYKNLITATNWIDKNTFPSQTPTVTLNKFVMGNPLGEYDTDQVHTAISTEVKSADGQTTEIWTGNLLPPNFAAGCLQYWSDNKGSHMDWKPVNEVPSSTASDSGKVLSVNSDGTTGWTTIPSSPYVLVDRSVSGWYSTIPAIVAAGKIPMFYDPYTYEGVQRNILYVYQYTDTSSKYVFMGTGVKIPDFTPSPKFFYVTYTLDTSTGSGGVTGCDANGIGEETINSTSRLSGDTLSIDNNRAYKITNTSILGKSNLIIKIEDVATADYAANVSIELTPTTNMTLTVKKWNTTLKYSVAAGNQLTAGKTYQVTAFGGCWTMAEFKLPD